MVEGFGDAYGSECCLAVERHLELKCSRGVVLQCLRHVVELAIGSSVSDRHWRVEVVVERCHEVNLWQQPCPVLADVVFTLDNLAFGNLQRQVILNAYVQALSQRQLLLRSKRVAEKHQSKCEQ